MHTSIRLVPSYKSTDSLVLLADDKGNIPANILTPAEADFIKREFKAERRSVLINQYKRLIFIYRPDYKKDVNRLREDCRRAGDAMLGAINRNKLREITISDFPGRSDLALATAEGMALGNYQFLKYRKEEKKERNSLSVINIHSKGLAPVRVSDLMHSVDAVCRARDLVNEPQSWLTATRLAGEFVKLGKEAGFKVTVFGKQRIAALRMGGLLAVNQGSKEPPTFTVMEWKPRNAKNKKPFVLVGKGVVYDTGGLSLKPTPNSMDYMKSDMAGAAAVACTMYAVAKAKLPVHVIALVPSTDNKLSAESYVPGDIITMMSGLRVEVLNTDAEGRLILADALHYAKQLKPELVMDFATLTGAAAAAVGPFGIVCMGTADENIRTRLRSSGEAVYERLAEFPFWDEYDELLKSDVADMKNIGGPIGGAITAGKFLQRFTDYPWMHFDIAGPSFLHTPASYRGKHGTGVGVRLMFEYFSSLT